MTMRLLLSLALLAGFSVPLSIVGGSTFAAAAEECSGDNCPPPDQGNSGHDCERKKQEPTVS
jgi:hypothetical protein